MAFPTVVGSASGSGTGATLSITVPAGFAGDLLLAHVCATDPVTWTTPTGWTLLGNASLSAHSSALYVRIDDTAGGGGQGFTANVADAKVGIIYRVRGHGGLALVAASTAATGVSGTPNPGSCTPSWGATDTLWIATSGLSNIGAVTSWPSSYADNQLYATRSGGSPSMRFCTRELNTTTQDPGAWSLTSAGSWVAFTVAIGTVPFVADFTSDVQGGDASLAVAFTDLSSGGTGTLTSWAWDFGDGTTSTAQHPVHTYMLPGDYTVTLTAGTSAAETDTETKVGYVSVTIHWIPPAPANAIVEIRAAAPGSSRWGSALWGTGEWSSAGWQDVTPQSVDAFIRWGSHSPEAGILAEVEAASWIVNTYDPERLLDPGNPDSPYAADLHAGLPIRIRHRGMIIRQGVAETIAYFHANNVGGIRVTDNLSVMARTTVPEDVVLADTLHARARDAIAAAGLAITVVNRSPDPVDPALLPQTFQARSVWRWIADAAEQVLHMAYVDRLGYVLFRPWAAPADYGRYVDATNLVELGTIVQTRGLYSVVQAVDDTDAVVERSLTPMPRYGRVLYRRDDPTPDAGAWCDAVLADRGPQTVQWIPGEIHPLSADDVEYFALLGAMERIAVIDDSAEPPVSVTGILVGGEIRLRSKRDSEAIWSFALELAQTESV